MAPPKHFRCCRKIISKMTRTLNRQKVFSVKRHYLKSYECVYSNSRNDVPRVAQRYGTIAAHTRRRASVLVVFVVFCHYLGGAGVEVFFMLFDILICLLCRTLFIRIFTDNKFEGYRFTSTP